MLTVVALAVALGAAACGDGGTKEKATSTPAGTATKTASAVEIPTLDITAVDGRLDAPASIPGGLTRIRLHNAGTEDHQAELVRLKDGATADQFLAAFKNPDFATGKSEGVALTTLEGGPDNVPPGATSEAVLDLQPGQYVLLCVNFSARLGFHWATGEFRPLEVTAAPAPQPAKPDAQATVRLSDFAFDAPETLPAGTTTVEVVNDAQQEHEMLVVRLKDTATVDQIRDTFLSTIPDLTSVGTSVGGMGELLPGNSGWARLNLTPGRYALVCGLVDLGTGSGGTGKQHVTLGMFHAFTVQ